MTGGGPGQVQLSWDPAGLQRVGRPGLVRRRGLAGRQRRPVLHPRRRAPPSWLLEDLAPGVDYTVRLVAVSPERHLAAGDPASCRAARSRWPARRRPGGASGSMSPGRCATRPVRGWPAGGCGWSAATPARRRTASSTRPAPPPTAASRSPGTPAAAAGGSWSTPVRRRDRHPHLVPAQRGAPAGDRCRARSPPARPGQSVDLHGSVLPARSGRVVLQRRGPDGGWDAVARAEPGPRQLGPDLPGALGPADRPAGAGRRRGRRPGWPSGPAGS